MSEPDFDKLNEGLAEFVRQYSEVLVPVLRRLAEAMGKLTDEMVPLIAAEGISEFEMGLRLRDEIGLRTDLLSLFDDETL